MCRCLNPLPGTPGPDKNNCENVASACDHEPLPAHDVSFFFDFEDRHRQRSNFWDTTLDENGSTCRLPAQPATPEPYSDNSYGGGPGFFLRLPAHSRMLTAEGLVIVDSILAALGLEEENRRRSE